MRGPSSYFVISTFIMGLNMLNLCFDTIIGHGELEVARWRVLLRNNIKEFEQICATIILSTRVRQFSSEDKCVVVTKINE